MKKVRKASERNMENQRNRGDKRRGVNSRKVTYLLFALAAVLLLGSTIGSTRAALTYYSENYTAQITVSQIGVSLLENGQVVSSRDYDQDEWKTDTNQGKDKASGVLLRDMLSKDKDGKKEKLALNKRYEEKLSVKNSGTIDEYVRVRIYKYWTQKNESGQDVKVTTLSPALIDLNLVNEDRWVKNPADAAETEGGSEKECTELYYKGILTSGSESVPFADTIRIDGEVASEAKVETKGNVITTTYKYDGVEFHVDVEVDAVQTHNAQDAIRSAYQDSHVIFQPSAFPAARSSSVKPALREDENMRRRIGSLSGLGPAIVLTAALVFGSSMVSRETAFAEDRQGASGWQVTFDGKKMSSNFTTANMGDEINQMQPGDSVELTITLKNTCNENADWYMKNEVLSTLEDAGDAAGGAYDYLLTYTDTKGALTTLYSSEKFGGDGRIDGVGLHGATAALEDYFYLDRMGKGDTGVVKLKVALDGETLVNNYQNTYAKLRMDFATELAGSGNTPPGNTPGRNREVIKTGDQTQVMLYVMLMLGAGLVLMLLAVLRMKREREDEPVTEDGAAASYGGAAGADALMESSGSGERRTFGKRASDGRGYAGKAFDGAADGRSSERRRRRR